MVSRRNREHVPGQANATRWEMSHETVNRTIHQKPDLFMRN